MQLEEKLLRLCIQKNISLGFAESCTGGALAARITRIPGASKCFVGSVVSYQNKIKTNLLGVSQKLLMKHGAVSAEVSLAMLKGILQVLSCDLGLAITGFAGPESGIFDTLVGTVFIALGGANFKTDLMSLKLDGSREEIIQTSVDHAVLALIKSVEQYQ